MRQVAGAVVGVELGFHRTPVVARRVDQKFDQAVARVVATGAAATGGRWVTDVVDAIRDLVGTDLGEEDIAAIGLGVPRMVSPPTGTLVPPALPPWGDADDPAKMLFEELANRPGTPRLLAPAVILDNDANLAAYAESVYVHRDVETLVAVKASIGIGAGIVVGGRIFRGRHGIAGEIGHTVVDPAGRFCSCGGRGCLETLIGADALVEQAKTVLGHRKLESPDTVETLVEMASRGNPACQRVLREAGSTLGFALGNLGNLLGPDVVVIGGTLGRGAAASIVLEPLRESFGKSAMAAATGAEGVTICPTQLSYAAAHGALVVALEGTEYRDPAA